MDRKFEEEHTKDRQTERRKSMSNKKGEKYFPQGHTSYSKKKNQIFFVNHYQDIPL